MLRVLPPARHQGGGARRRHLAVGRRAARRGRGRDRHLAHEPRARGRLRRTASPASRSASPTSASARRSRREGFFYAPDPSSQLACTLAGNIAMNSGGAHCLKYGVTTNNVLGLKMVLMDGEIDRDRRRRTSIRRATTCWGSSIGSEGQFGIVTEATVRILRAAEGARPMLLGFDSSEAAGQCVSAIIGAGIIPVAIEFMDKPAIHVCEAFAKAGYPLDVEALLIVEVEGSDEEIADLLARHHRASPSRSIPRRAHQPERRAERRHLEGPQGGVRRHRPHLRLLLHGRHHPARQAGRGAGRHLAHLRRARPQGRQHLPRRRRQPASADPLRRQRRGRGRAGRAGRRRDPRAVRGRPAAASPASTASASRSAT